MKQDVIIYGAGFAGLSQALSLADKVENILILEPLSQELYGSIMKRDTRTTALSYNSKIFYESIGLWKELEHFCGPIDDIRIVDADYLEGDSPLKLHFSSNDVSDEPMGYIIDNGSLKRTLLSAVQAKSNISIQYGSKIISVQNKAEGVYAKLANRETISASLLLATDGKNSKLRDLIGIKTIDKDYHQSAVTFNIEHAKPHNKLAIERFMPTGPFAVLPMKNGKQSSIVWTVKKTHANYFMSMKESEFISHVQNRLGDYLGDIKLISDRLAFPLSLRYTKRYYEGRVVLIGDTAHGIHPIAGQGFNQGVKDIQKLTAMISERTSLGLDIYSEELLYEYESQAFSDNIQMILATDFFNSLFSNDSSILKLGRRLGISAVDKVHKVKSFFIKRAMGA